MSNTETFKLGRVRFLIFTAVAILHLLLMLLVAFNIETIIAEPEPVAGVMKLVDVEERAPPPPEKPVEPVTNTVETVAETMIETEEAPPPPVVYTEPAPPPPVEQIEYLQQHKVTTLAVLPEGEILRAAVYPSIALRSGIEGTVYLELYIDRSGNIRDIIILRESPSGRGFGEAAVNALKGIQAKPAEANGVPVASRLRYNYTFRIKQ